MSKELWLSLNGDGSTTHICLNEYNAEHNPIRLIPLADVLPLLSALYFIAIPIHGDSTEPKVFAREALAEFKAKYPDVEGK